MMTESLNVRIATEARKARFLDFSDQRTLLSLRHLEVRVNTNMNTIASIDVKLIRLGVCPPALRPSQSSWW